MLPANEFRKYHPGEDKYAKMEVQLSFAHIPKKFIGVPKLSYMISTYNRKNQLSRTLETLCRQSFREFEVLVMDDGSTENLPSLFEIFEPYIQLRTFRVERGDWHGCPSRAYKQMLADTRGEIIAIGHPEIMLCEDALWYLYISHTMKLKDCYYYVVDTPNITSGRWQWTSLKPNHFSDDLYEQLNTVDWHTNLDNVMSMVGWGEVNGYAHFTNDLIRNGTQQYPWWVVASARKECPIWDDLPVFDGHGIIDMWFYHYRRLNRIVDCVPEKVLCYHQPHQTSAVSPPYDMDNMDLEEMERQAVLNYIEAL
jgi:glycosyltransferase involved in cell wall biosynthesis